MRFLLMFLVGFIGFHSALLAKDQKNNEKANEFVQKFENYEFPDLKRKTVRFSKASPWYGYLEQPFDLVLSKSQKKQYLSFQKEGQCLNVLEFDLLGFLQNHSHLVSVFENNKLIKQQFLSQIAPLFSRGYVRCLALARLKKNDFFKSPKSEALIIKVETNKSIQPSIFNERQKILKVTLQEIFETAICQDYLPAQMDIIEWKEQKLAFDFSYETLFYLLKRAEKQSADSQVSSLARTADVLLTKTPYKSIIVEAASDGEFKKLEYAMPFWFQRCSGEWRNN